eukprot:403368052
MGNCCNTFDGQTEQKQELVRHPQPYTHRASYGQYRDQEQNDATQTLRRVLSKQGVNEEKCQIQDGVHLDQSTQNKLKNKTRTTLISPTNQNDLIFDQNPTNQNAQNQINHTASLNDSQNYQWRAHNKESMYSGGGQTTLLLRQLNSIDNSLNSSQMLILPGALVGQRNKQVSMYVQDEFQSNGNMLEHNHQQQQQSQLMLIEGQSINFGEDDDNDSILPKPQPSSLNKNKAKLQFGGNRTRPQAQTMYKELTTFARHYDSLQLDNKQESQRGKNSRLYGPIKLNDSSRMLEMDLNDLLNCGVSQGNRNQQLLNQSNQVNSSNVEQSPLKKFEKSPTIVGGTQQYNSAQSNNNSNDGNFAKRNFIRGFIVK